MQYKLFIVLLIVNIIIKRLFYVYTNFEIVSINNLIVCLTILILIKSSLIGFVHSYPFKNPGIQDYKKFKSNRRN